MTDKIDLFKMLLKKEYWNLYAHRIDKDIFPETLHDLYESLEDLGAFQRLPIQWLTA